MLTAFAGSIGIIGIALILSLSSGINAYIGQVQEETLTNYPITIFPKAIQFILTFLLPFAFLNFYPASALLGKAIPQGYPAILPFLSPLVGALVFALSVLLWNWGLKHYKSTGS